MTARIVGLLISGFAVRAYAAGLAIWAVSQAVPFILNAFAAINNGFGAP